MEKNLCSFRLHKIPFYLMTKMFVFVDISLLAVGGTVLARTDFVEKYIELF